MITCIPKENGSVLIVGKLQVAKDARRFNIILAVYVQYLFHVSVMTCTIQ